MDLFTLKPCVRLLGIMKKRVEGRLRKLVRQNLQDPFGSAKLDQHFMDEGDFQWIGICEMGGICGSYTICAICGMSGNCVSCGMSGINICDLLPMILDF